MSDRLLGIIRIKGTPKYYNGKNFGELCVSIEAFVTQDDLRKFKPKNVIIKKFCFSNPNTPFVKLKSKARKAAYIEIVKRHNPALQNISMDEARSVVHNFYVSNENVDINTGAYCMDISANIIPIEIDILTGNRRSLKNKFGTARKISKTQEEPKLKWRTVKLSGKFRGWGSTPGRGEGTIYYSFAFEKPVDSNGDIWLAVCFPNNKLTCFRINGFWLGELTSLKSVPKKISVPKDFATMQWRGKGPTCMKLGHYYILESKSQWVLIQILDFKVTDRKVVSHGIFHDTEKAECSVIFRYFGPAKSLASLNAELSAPE